MSACTSTICFHRESVYSLQEGVCFQGDWEKASVSIELMASVSSKKASVARKKTSVFTEKASFSTEKPSISTDD